MIVLELEDNEDEIANKRWTIDTIDRLGFRG